MYKIIITDVSDKPSSGWC